MSSPVHMHAADPQDEHDAMTFKCVICDRDGVLEVTWPDGYPLIVCADDAPSPDYLTGTMIDVWNRWRENYDR